MEDKHPVQAMVWGIVSLVVSAIGLFFIIPQIVLPLVYVAMKGGNVPAEDLHTTAAVFFVIVVVFGVVSFVFGLTSLIIRGATAKFYLTPDEDGRFHSGLVTRKIAFPLAIIEIVACVLSTTFASLALQNIL
jgi:hypothetical protein